MNKIFKSKFNKTLGSWVAVSELVKGFCKNSKSSLTAIALVALTASAHAAPGEVEGGVVDLTATDSVAIGNGSEVKGGNNNLAAAGGFVAAEYKGTNSENAISIGKDAFAAGQNATAIGNGTFALTNALSFGLNSFAFKEHSLSVGENNIALGTKSSAVGYQNLTSSEYANAFGSNNYAGELKNFGVDDAGNFKFLDLVSDADAAKYNEKFASKSLKDRLKELYAGSVLNGKMDGKLKDFYSSNGKGKGLYSNLTKEFRDGLAEIIDQSIEAYNTDSCRINDSCRPFKQQTALGSNNIATGSESTAVGSNNFALGQLSSVFGNSNSALRTKSSAFGYGNLVVGPEASAVGSRNVATGRFSLAYGVLNQAISDNYSTSQNAPAIAFGYFNKAEKLAISVGRSNTTVADTYAFGVSNKIINFERPSAQNPDEKEIVRSSKDWVFGYDNKLEGVNNSTVIGGRNQIKGSDQVSVFGYKNTIAKKTDFKALKENEKVKNYVREVAAFDALVAGHDNIVDGVRNIVIGNNNKSDYLAKNAIIIGNGSKALSNPDDDLNKWSWNTVAIGNGILANVYNSVFLGGGSSSDGYHTIDVPEDAEWKGVPSRPGNTLGIVTVGKAGSERQIQNVAAGRVTKDSTDAINGSQLFWFKKSLDEKIGKLLPAIADEKGTTVKPKDQKVVIGGGVAEEENKPENFTTGNITSETEKGEDDESNGKLIIKLAKNIKGLESIEVTDDKGEGTRITKDGIETKVAKKDENGDVVKDQEGKTVYETKAMGTNFAGDDGKAVNIPLNQTLNLKGGATDVSTENNIGVVKGNDNTLNVRLAKNLKGIESIDGLKEMSYDEMQSDANKNKAVSVKSLENYLEKYGSGGTSGGSGGFNGDAGGKEITNLKPGTRHDSAATVGQVEERYDDALGASAMAMATSGLPQATAPGKSMVSVAGSTLDGKQGYALGISTVSGNGKWVIKGSVAGSSRKQLGATIGAGYQW
ncbi:YadA-like family protein [Taylorella asinigenitalis]|uniref:YadA-like family protein n=1 Tax=Taylorella asinigenitalis TaxID=84590 RepID=UPI00049038DA|nr:YadA-like family protein [Taylorella asinigenitalis]